MPLWYDSDGNVDDDSRMSTHVVVVSARSANRGDAGVCQCLGYMGSYISPDLDDFEGSGDYSYGAQDPQGRGWICRRLRVPFRQLQLFLLPH